MSPSSTASDQAPSLRQRRSPSRATLLALTAPLPGLIAIPLAYFAGIAGTARQGVLIRSPETVEALRRAKAAAFDKNGTMTTGAYHVAAVRSERLDARTFLQLAAMAAGPGGAVCALGSLYMSGAVRQAAAALNYGAES